MNDLITVILPIYNVRDYLADCLNSIINQTYTNLEIIIVDDGSTDNSEQIYTEFAERDSRIKFYKKENGGPASGRNYALDRMHGKYVTFIDGDDCVEPEYCEELHRMAKEYNADMTQCTEFSSYGDREASKISTVYTRDEYASLLLPDVVYNSHVIDKMFRADIFNGIRFSDHFRTMQDMEILPLLLKKMKTIVVSKRQLYFYRLRQGSILRSDYGSDPFTFINRAVVFWERYEITEGWLLEIRPVLIKKAVDESLYCINIINRKYYAKYKWHYDTIQKYFASHIKDILKTDLKTKQKTEAKILASGHLWFFFVKHFFGEKVRKVLRVFRAKRYNTSK